MVVSMAAAKEVSVAAVAVNYSAAECIRPEEEVDKTCPECGAMFSLDEPVDTALEVWCEPCWHVMSEDDRASAVAAVQEGERESFLARGPAVSHPFSLLLPE